MRATNDVPRHNSSNSAILAQRYQMTHANGGLNAEAPALALKALPLGKTTEGFSDGQARLRACGGGHTSQAVLVSSSMHWLSRSWGDLGPLQFLSGCRQLAWMDQSLCPGKAMHQCSLSTSSARLSGCFLGCTILPCLRQRLPFHPARTFPT